MKKTTKSTDDGFEESAPTLPKTTNRLMMQDTNTISDRSMVNSTKTMIHLVDHGIIDDLIPVSTMNKIASRLEEPLSKLPNIDPTQIAALQDVYDPSEPVEGPLMVASCKLTYYGQVKDSRANGWGKIVTKKGDYLEGFFVEGIVDYYYRMLDRRGLYYEGGIKNSLKHGRGILRDANGIRINTTWRAGQATGYTVVTTEEELEPLKIHSDQDIFRKSAEGQYIIFEGTLKDGLKTGLCYTLDTHKRYSLNGEFLNDQIQGFGKKHYFSGAYFIGNFFDGLEEGFGTLFYADGRIYEGEFKGGVPNGSGFLTTNSGLVRPCSYTNGVMEKPTAIITK